MAYKDHLRSVRDGVAGLVREGVEDASGAAQGALARGRDMHNSVKEQGGYANFAKSALEKASEGVSSSVREYFGRVERGYDELRKQVCDDEGNFDYEKAKSVVADKAGAVTKFGRKTVDRIVELTAEGVERAKTGWNTLFPSADELKGKYEGIGVGSEKPILFRPDYENCLGFYNNARKILPGGLRVRSQILETIKGKCCTDVSELVQAYESRAEEGKESLAVIRKYFPSKN